MAAKGEAKVKLTLTDGGTVSVTRKELERLNAEMGKTQVKQKGIQTGSNKTKRGFEGVSQRANNASKDFSRMSQGMGGLVQAYATVAANVFALSTAFNVLSSATNFQDMISSARNLSAELGTSFLTTAVAIQGATKAQIDFKTALRAANKASASGISAKNVTKFAEAAAKSAQTFGGTTTDALNRMVTAILQGETELLKEVGIVISSNEAFLQYGITIGKAANQLTSFEKRQALSNAVLKESDRLFAGTEIQENNYEILAANLLDASQEVLNFVNNSLGLSSVIGAIADSLPVMAAGVALFAASIVKKLRPSVNDVLKQAQDSAKKIRILENRAIEQRNIAEKKAGVAIIRARQEKAEKEYNIAKKASKRQVDLLIQEGKLKAAAIRKGSTLRNIQEGKGASTRGVAALQSNRGKVLNIRRKSSTDPGLTKAERTKTLKALNAETAAAKALAQANKDLAASQSKVAKSSASFATSLKIQKQELVNANQTTRAAILQGTQHSTTLGFFADANKAAAAELARMEVTAKKSGVALTRMQKAGNKAALGIAKIGHVASKTFAIFTTAIIVVQTISFALEALGLDLFSTSAAEKDVEEASTEMAEAFKESEKTLEGMIKSFKRFGELSADVAFEKVTIATGNFLQEIGGNLSSAVDVGIAKLNALAIAQAVLADKTKQAAKEQEKADKARSARFTELAKQGKVRQNTSGRGLGAAFSEGTKRATKEVTIAQKQLKDSLIDTETVSNLTTAALVEVEQILVKLKESGNSFPLLDELKKAPEITKRLGANLRDLKTPAELIGKFKSSLEGLSTEDAAKASVALSEALVRLGVRSTAAGKAQQELNAKVVLFEGTATRLRKSVFKDEAISNYVDLIELAAKAIKTIDANPIPGGLNNLSASLGTTTRDVRDFVATFEAAIEDAGRGTLQRNSENIVSGLNAKSLSVARQLSETFKESLSILKKKESLEKATLERNLANAEAERKVLSLTLEGVRRSQLKINTIDKQTRELKEQLSIVNSIAEAGDISLKLTTLELEKKSLEKVTQNFNQQKLKKDEIEAQIALLKRQLDIQSKNLASTKAEQEERGAIRQNARNAANIELQILSASKKVAESSGAIAEAQALSKDIAEKQLAIKLQDLAFDRASLEAKRDANNISKEQYDREVRLFALRQQSILLNETARSTTEALNEGRNLFSRQNSQLTSSRDSLTQEQVFHGIMIEGARKLKEELSKPGSLQIIVDGSFDAASAGVDALVTTIGTGQDETKAVLDAINDSLRNTVVDALQTGIKQELLKMFAQDTLAQTLDEVRNTTLANILAALQTGSSNTTGLEAGLSLLTTTGGEGGSTTGSASAVTGPPMASGGIVHRPTNTLIGEGKNSEAVVPLPNNREIPVKLEGNTGGNTQVTNNYDFSGADAATETRLRGLISESREGAFNDVFSSINRGGKFAKMSGRR